jgi:hypothetical protein
LGGILTATISPLLLLKLPVLAPSLNDVSRCSEADGDDVLRGFAKKSTLATGAERTEDSGMHTGEVWSSSGIIWANRVEGFGWNFLMYGILLSLFLS